MVHTYDFRCVYIMDQYSKTTLQSVDLCDGDVTKSPRRPHYSRDEYNSILSLISQLFLKDWNLMSLSKSRKPRSGGGDGSSAGSLPKLSQGIPHEVFFKMSKKIAQLTKVIYYLNSKHEDHDDELEATTEEYEGHLDEVNLD